MILSVYHVISGLYIHVHVYLNGGGVHQWCKTALTLKLEWRAPWYHPLGETLHLTIL